MARRKPSQLSTGRLQLLRLFSTLLAISLIDLGRFWVLATHLTYGAGTMTVMLPACLLTARTDTVAVMFA